MSMKAVAVALALLAGGLAAPAAAQVAPAAAEAQAYQGLHREIGRAHV